MFAQRQPMNITKRNRRNQKLSMKRKYIQICTFALICHKLDALCPQIKTIIPATTSKSFALKLSRFDDDPDSISTAFTKKAVQHFSPNDERLADHVVNLRDTICDIENVIGGSSLDTEHMAFSDLPFVILDVINLAITPDRKIILRFLNLVGNMLVFLDNLLATNHSMKPDELAIQVAVLFFSSTIFLKSALPTAKTFLQHRKTKPERKDVIAYRCLFEPVGFTWFEFKILLTSGALGWVELEPDSALIKEQVSDQSNQMHSDNRITTKNFTNGDTSFSYSNIDICWLYSGEIRVVCNGETVRHIKQKIKRDFRSSADAGLIFDMKYDDIKEAQECPQCRNVSICGAHGTSLETDSEGAVLLRSNNFEMRKLMDSNDKFAGAIQNLLLRSLWKKYRNNTMAGIE
eukprot:15365111-Ditylum_brightwellii.AAC.2